MLAGKIFILSRENIPTADCFGSFPYLLEKLPNREGKGAWAESWQTSIGPPFLNLRNRNVRLESEPPLAHVHFGSKAGIRNDQPQVRFAPKAGIGVLYSPFMAKASNLRRCLSAPADDRHAARPLGPFGNRSPITRRSKWIGSYRLMHEHEQNRQRGPVDGFTALIVINLQRFSGND